MNLESIKDFLKPNKWKIILTVIVVLIMLFMPLIYYAFNKFIFMPNETMAILIPGIKASPDEAQLGIFDIIKLVMFVFMVLFTYVMSCNIFEFYKKYKEKSINIKTLVYFLIILLLFNPISGYVLGFAVSFLTINFIFPNYSTLGGGGVEILSVDVNSPAYDAGLKQGDIIISINGVLTNTTFEFKEAFNDFIPNQTIKIQKINGDIINITTMANPANKTKAYLGITVKTYVV